MLKYIYVILSVGDCLPPVAAQNVCSLWLSSLFHSFKFLLYVNLIVDNDGGINLDNYWMCEDGGVDDHVLLDVRANGIGERSFV